MNNLISKALIHSETSHLAGQFDGSETNQSLEKCNAQTTIIISGSFPLALLFDASSSNI